VLFAAAHEAALARAGCSKWVWVCCQSFYGRAHHVIKRALVAPQRSLTCWWAAPNSAQKLANAGRMMSLRWWETETVMIDLYGYKYSWAAAKLANRIRLLGFEVDIRQAAA
jgi:hypothetical protein